ncbi:hypothetical protein [Stenotrophomonas sp. GD03657]|uniref:hypothetical protein n=1 Tax=Stenotrophomonas sp. GD03657 TaxID=2975363 RepID=UPI0024497261|nr:hypothetical protein [Stenotrophomonas sp. GD03657]MDH2154061.1 hypothetical protein [Stenotrophomonas sp. GD03657]
METKERKYPSKYELILATNPELVNYVEMIQRLMRAREDRKWAKQNTMPGPLEGAIDYDLIAIHGPRQTGKTLAIHEMATKPTDLIFLRDNMLIKCFQERQYQHSDAVIAPTLDKLWSEIRANPEEIFRRKEDGKLIPIGPEGFVPERIFVDDSYYVFTRTAEVRSFFRWASARWRVSPAIIGL